MVHNKLHNIVHTLFAHNGINYFHGVQIIMSTYIYYEWRVVDTAWADVGASISTPL